LTEAQWVERIAEILRTRLPLKKSLQIKTRVKLAYQYEIDVYPSEASEKPRAMASEFQTDLAIVESLHQGWKPRVVVEAKLGTVTSDGAITYSHKAGLHRAVQPYLRYGIMLGDREDYPLPGRLYRHGAQFDFMVSFKGLEPTEEELQALIELLKAEVEASRILEKIFAEHRKPGRDKYTVLHRKLILK